MFPAGLENITEDIIQDIRGLFEATASLMLLDNLEDAVNRNINPEYVINTLKRWNFVETLPSLFHAEIYAIYTVQYLEKDIVEIPKVS